MTEITLDSIERQALGRIANLGDLYDIRKDSFVHGNLFTCSHPPEEAIRWDGNLATSYSCLITETLMQKLALLDASLELKVNILSGMAKLSGAGSFFIESSNCSSSVSGTVRLCRSGRRKNINFLSPVMESHLNRRNLKPPNATHVVGSIIMGANILITVQDQNVDNKVKSEIKGNLNAELNKIKKMIDASGGVDVTGSLNYQNKTHNFHFSVNSDLGHLNIPQNYPEALQFIKTCANDLGQLSSSSDENTLRPISYILVPLAQLWRDFNVENPSQTQLLFSLHQYDMNQCDELLSDISDVKEELDSLFYDAKNHKFCLLPSQIQQIELLRNEFLNAVSELHRNFQERMTGLRTTNPGGEPLNPSS